MLGAACCITTHNSIFDLLITTHNSIQYLNSIFDLLTFGGSMLHHDITAQSFVLTRLTSQKVSTLL